jgi:2,4-dienoyl-CoA reductase-like NADH-dependent reductase (Old Yellow Enzyme family)
MENETINHERLLIKPLVAGNLHLKNRLVMPPMATAKSTELNNVSDELLEYYHEKSKGGHLGLIIVEHSYVSKEGRLRINQLSVSKDEDVESLKQLSQTIHENGSKCVMQINHGGDQVIDVGPNLPLSPSGVMNPPRETTPKIMTEEDIENVVTAFGRAAARVKAAGFDGVEIHSAHGYLLNQFYSPLTNKRIDSYGGSIQGRIKIHLDVIKAIRDQVGDDFPILLRLGASDYTDGGTTIEDSIFAAAEFKKAGICILDVTGGMCRYSPKGLSGQGYFSSLTEAIREAVDIPVILTGGITEPEAAEALLKSGMTDLIGVGRAILNDSDWARRAIEN